MDKHYHQPYGKTEDANCCPPFATSDYRCKWHPGWRYKCGGCHSGVMCYAQKACNTLIKMEGKIDAWKVKYYDPLIERLSEAAVNADKADVIASNSLFKKCGIP